MQHKNQNPPESTPDDWVFLTPRRVLKPANKAEYYSLTVQHDEPLAKIFDEHIQKAKTVLDLGCGEGSWLQYLAAKYPYKKFVGIDFSESALNFARKQTRGLKNVKIKKGDVRKLGEKADFIYSFGVLEHFSDHAALLKHWVSRLNQDGRILITVPNRERNDFFLSLYLSELAKKRIPRVKIARDRIITDIYGHLELWTQDYLASLFKNCAKIQKTFSLQAIIQLPSFADRLMPLKAKELFYKTFASEPKEKNGLIIGVVASKLQKTREKQ